MSGMRSEQFSGTEQGTRQPSGMRWELLFGLSKGLVVAPVFLG